jgi:hypothetical protein
MPIEIKRQQLKETTTLAIATTIEITDLLKDRSIPEIAGQLRKTMPAVAKQFGNVAGIISARDYDKERSTQNLPTEYKAKPAILSNVDEMDAAIGFGIAQLTKGVSYDTFQSTLSGGVQRLVLQGDRETIDLNIVSDPDGTTYERVPSANSCAFCLTMAAVAEAQRDSYFDGYHNFCRCTLRPIFTGGKRTELPIYKQVNEAYSLADKELERQRQEFGWYSMKTKQAAALRPDLVMNTPNHLRLMRQVTGWH